VPDEVLPLVPDLQQQQQRQQQQQLARHMRLQQQHLGLNEQQHDRQTLWKWRKDTLWAGSREAQQISPAAVEMQAVVQQEPVDGSLISVGGTGDRWGRDRKSSVGEHCCACLLHAMWPITAQSEVSAPAAALLLNAAAQPTGPTSPSSCLLSCPGGEISTAPSCW
jgi:hypothetical protein